MGGGTGTGSASVIAQIARELGALTVAVVTKPFIFEGRRRLKHAETGIDALAQHVDTLITIPNQRLLQIANSNLSLIDAFKMADNVLVNAVKGISDIINIPGTINVDFADVKTIMSSMGQALMGIGIASGENRASEAAQQAISSPLLEDVNIEGATGILINITAGKDISLLEINEACMIIQDAAHEDANIIFGAVVEENTGDEMRVTVIATGFPGELTEPQTKQKLFHAATRTSPLTKKPIRSNINYCNEKIISKKTKIPENNDFIFFKNESNLTTKTNAAIENQKQNKQIQPCSPTKSSFQKLDSIGNLNEQKTTQTSSFKFKTDTSLQSRTEKEPSIVVKGSNSQLNKKQPEPSYMTQSTQKNLDENLDENIDKKIDEALQLAERVNNITKTTDELDIPTFLRQEAKDTSIDNS